MLSGISQAQEKKKKNHPFSLTYRIFKKVISWENGVDQCCGGKKGRRDNSGYSVAQ